MEQTAFGPMVIAACERYVPQAQRLLDDDLALRFLPPDQRLAVRACRWSAVRGLVVGATERLATGLWGSLLCRKRYIDDKVGEALAAGIDQLEGAPGSLVGKGDGMFALSASHRRVLYLGCGLAAGPLLLGVLLVDGATRAGYDPWRHGVSQLVLGDRGWLASTAFVVCGLLMAGFTLGVQRVGRDGPGSTWGPRMLGALAVGLVVAGVFPTDPTLGYPPGEVERLTPAGAVHQVGGFLLFAGLIGTGIVWGRRFARGSRRGLAIYSIATAALVTVSALSAGVIYRLVQKGIVGTGPAGLLELVSFGLGFTGILLLAAHLLREASTTRALSAARTRTR